MLNAARTAIVFVALAAFWAGPGYGQNGDLLATASPEQLVEALTPKYSKTRGLLVETTPIAVNSFGDELAATVNLAVEFEFNSATLTPQAETLLSVLGEALGKPELSGFRFLVGGHTDAVGSDDFNLELSERRAQATRDFIKAKYAVSDERLVVRAFGETALLVPDVPDDGRNRRVEISTLN